MLRCSCTPSPLLFNSMECRLRLPFRLNDDDKVMIRKRVAGRLFGLGNSSLFNKEGDNGRTIRFLLASTNSPFRLG